IEFSEQLEKDLKKTGIKSFDYSQYKDHEIIGRGGCAVVYSALFKKEKHALKSLNNNLSFDEKALKRVRREHSNNILINEGKALISDFGISKQLNDTTASSSVMMGVPAYVDPQYLQNGDKLNMKSDIYSLGVLLWELTSGIPPFHNIPEMAIILEILKNNRERTIDNTPLKYSNLYKQCWTSEPQQRPTSSEILVVLENLSSETTVDFITNIIRKDNHKKATLRQSS
ncbi:3842_t:CDS:2, partial [Cetraspora pellucida]